jgi:hypothetical protein
LIIEQSFIIPKYKNKSSPYLLLLNVCASLPERGSVNGTVAPSLEAAAAAAVDGIPMDEA